MQAITAENPLHKLLLKLADNETDAADRYEELRLKLTCFFGWKGVPNFSADALADVVIERVTLKISQGVEINNINSYAYEVARFVWLEHLRKNKEVNFGEDAPEIADKTTIIEEPDARLKCLRKCLVETIKDAGERELVITYYGADAGEKNKDLRKKLAEKFGLTANNLKVKVLRLRARLEKCISSCVGQKV